MDGLMDGIMDGIIMDGMMDNMDGKQLLSPFLGGRDKMETD